LVSLAVPTVPQTVLYAVEVLSRGDDRINLGAIHRSVSCG
jgi:hypothetical protein